VDGSISGNGFTSVNPLTPYVVMYSASPLYGTNYAQALKANNNYLLDPDESELRVVASPYFFSTSGVYQTTPLSFQWKINDLSVGTPSTTSIVLKKPANTTGKSNVSVKTSADENEFMQFYTTGISISYTADQ
jgi:hypothetical protein